MFQKYKSSKSKKVTLVVSLFLKDFDQDSKNSYSLIPSQGLKLKKILGSVGNQQSSGVP